MLSWKNWLSKACSTTIDLDKEADNALATKYSKAFLDKGHATAGKLAKGLHDEAGKGNCISSDAAGWLVDSFQMKFAHAKEVVQILVHHLSFYETSINRIVEAPVFRKQHQQQYQCR